MRFIVLILIVVLVLCIPFIYSSLKQWADDEDRQRTGSHDPRARDIRNNHAAMARLLDHILADDMTRVVLSEDQQAAARNLLAAYYPDGDSQ